MGRVQFSVNTNEILSPFRHVKIFRSSHKQMQLKMRDNEQNKQGSPTKESEQKEKTKVKGEWTASYAGLAFVEWTTKWNQITENAIAIVRKCVKYSDQITQQINGKKWVRSAPRRRQERVHWEMCTTWWWRVDFRGVWRNRMSQPFSRASKFTTMTKVSTSWRMSRWRHMLNWPQDRTSERHWS